MSLINWSWALLCTEVFTKPNLGEFVKPTNIIPAFEIRIL